MQEYRTAAIFTIIASEYMAMETAMIGLLRPWVFLFFQKRMYIEAAKRIVKNPDASWKSWKFSDLRPSTSAE